MRSKTWFFNATVLKKNITRFCPVWIVYSALMLLPKLSNIGLGLLVNFFSGPESGYGDMGTLVSGTMTAATLTIEFATMTITHFLYAMVCALVLFGDLFRSRMCNALHALPIRREGWFFTNVVTGLLFSFVPNLAVTLLMLPACGSAWQIPLLWLAAATMQYLFFFSVAVLSAYCTGKRFAMAVVYFLINLFSMLLYWLVETVFGKLLYGVVISDEIFLLLCPLVHLMSYPYVEFDYVAAIEGFVLDETGGMLYTWSFADGWGYLAICAVVGIGLLALALLCCRRRNLEAAGDFIAFRALKPVTLVFFTLFAGMVLSLFLLPAFVGFAIGFFAGMMLLERTVRVFRKKTFLGAGIFLGAYVVILLVLYFDLFGIIRWVPQVQDVKTVRMEYSSVELTLDEPEEIEGVLTIHRQGIADRSNQSTLLGYTIGTEDSTKVKLKYTTRTGGTQEREYYIADDSEAAALLQQYASTPEAVLGDLYTSGAEVVTFRMPGSNRIVSDPAQIDALMDAILADCEAGRLPQNWEYADTRDYFNLELNYYDAKGKLTTCSFRVYRDSYNIMGFMKANKVGPFAD